MAVAPATEFAAEFLISLVELGVQHVVVSPGARSQALALVAAGLESRGDIQLHVRIDERVAGFTALGIALETGKPAVVMTTSGSAVAHLHPAILEAHHAGVPMIVVTADRPEELRGIGSNQTTNQRDIYGPAVRWSQDEPAPLPEQENTQRAKKLALQAWEFATQPQAPGPVHLNIGFREPLSSPAELRAVNPVRSTTLQSTPAIHVELDRGPKTVVIAGAGAGAAAEELAHAGGWPLIAEVSSGARFGRNLVPAYRAVLADKNLVGDMERIVVFGHPTLSREVPALIANTDLAIETIVVNSAMAECYNPGHNVGSFADSVSVVPGEPDKNWLGRWIKAGRAAADEHEHHVLDSAVQASPNVAASRSQNVEDRKAFLAAELAASKVPVSRELLVDALWRATWPHNRLLFGASRLIRVADNFVSGKKIPVFANRGLAGIDGTISTGVGIALAAEPALTRVVVGDITALHDVGGLAFATGETRPRIQVIVGNDGGGTMFDLLEVRRDAAPADFDRVMFTAQNVEFEHLAAAYGWKYIAVKTVSELERALTGAGEGPELIEVKLAR